MDEPHRTSAADERLSHHSQGALRNSQRVTEEREIRPALIYSPPETQSEPWRVNPIQAGPVWTLSFTDTNTEVAGKFLMSLELSAWVFIHTFGVTGNRTATRMTLVDD